jgi:hypothetical protein
MTPKEQQVAIEEACGWTVWSCGVPDYLNDLNAMHEAEKVLWDTGKAMEFTNQLVGIVCSARGFRWDKGTPDDHLMCLSHATASQRAEAFLRTIGKWKECK